MTSSLLPPCAADQLLHADPAQWPVAPGWQPLVAEFFASAAGQALQTFLQQRQAAGAVIFPPEPLRALALTDAPAVRVVILGQDPYHGRGQAEGLAFSVAPGVRLPPSLRNIFKEIARESGQVFVPPVHGSLVAWAQQGVLLLNTSLTVEQGAAASHAGQGWEVLTDALIKALSTDPRPKAFLLWGVHAQAKRILLDERRHRVLTSNHPSPLSALKGPAPFIGNGHFGLVNRFLSDNGQIPVSW